MKSNVDHVEIGTSILIEGGEPCVSIVFPELVREVWFDREGIDWVIAELQEARAKLAHIQPQAKA